MRSGEFHDAKILRKDGADSPFRPYADAGAPLRRGAFRRDDMMGLFVHLIDARPIDIDPDAAHKRPERRNE